MNIGSEIRDSAGVHLLIPVVFIPGHVAVNEEQAIEMMGLADGRRTIRAAKNAFWEFRRKNGIPKLPGGVFSVNKIMAAADQDERLKRRAKRSLAAQTL